MQIVHDRLKKSQTVEKHDKKRGGTHKNPQHKHLNIYAIFLIKSHEVTQLKFQIMLEGIK